jgi:radical SAM protein (TIGR01212 family)
MTSSQGRAGQQEFSAIEGIPFWRKAGLRYFSLSYYLKTRFGRKVWKLSLDAGCSCPNVDGTVSHQGCIFCDLVATAPSRRLGLARKHVRQQIEEGIARVGRGGKVSAFIAYFQPGTNTHGDLGRLAQLWEEAASHPQVVGVAVGTRPDAVPDPVLDVLAELNTRTWVQLELGVQSAHDRSLAWLRRHHDAAVCWDAIRRAKARNLFVVAHLILGIPGETLADGECTARWLGSLGVDGVKIHNLHVLRGTDLERLWRSGQFQPIPREEYVEAVASFLECLPPSCVIERLVGDAPAEFLLAPQWALDKAGVILQIHGELERRGTFQGSRFDPRAPAPFAQ